MRLTHYFSAGLGDVIRNIYLHGCYESLSNATTPTAVVVASHNLFSIEIFRHHRNARNFLLYDLGHKYQEFLDAGMRGVEIVRAMEAFTGLPLEESRRTRPSQGYKPVFDAPDNIDSSGHIVFAPFAGGGSRNFSRDLIGQMLTVLRQLPVTVFLVCRSYRRTDAKGRVIHDGEDAGCYAGGNVVVLDNLSVPATLNLVRNASAFVGSWSSLLQAAWFEERPAATFYPPQWAEVTNGSGYAFGVSRADCFHCDYVQFDAGALQTWLQQWTGCNAAPVEEEVSPWPVEGTLWNPQIPRKVHQTWKTPYPHPALAQCMASFKHLNPGWEHCFYTDEQCLDWVGRVCPPLLPVYEGFATGIHRADFFRILVLYYEGGVYADIDVECLRPLDELLAAVPEDKSLYLTRDHPVHERKHFGGRAMWMNDFMIAAPGDPFLAEVIQWMALNPVSSGAANAVIETGPGVLSAVMEMLGGPECIPTLGVLPVPWIHALPDMNCDFPERKVYQQIILNRSWLTRNAFVVHYWFHTWVTGAGTNTLTDYADALLSTRGERVERLLQWLLRDSNDPVDGVLGCALAEVAERGMAIVFMGCEEAPSPMLARLRELIHWTGLQGLVRQESAADNVLRVCSAGSSAIMLHGKGRLSGWVLGPALDHGVVVAQTDDLCLTEVWHESAEVPMCLHLFPRDEPFAEVIAAHVEGCRLRSRQWSRAEVAGLLADAGLSRAEIDHMSTLDQDCGAALLVLWRHGGWVFEGDSRLLVKLVCPLHEPTLREEAGVWWFAVPAACSLLDGAFEHWLQARKRSRGQPPDDDREKLLHVAADLRVGEYLKRWLPSLQRLSRAKGLVAIRPQLQVSYESQV
jgi:Glycosyltransferase sugar-binding region containing DXD motif